MGQGIFDAVNLTLRSWEKTMYGWLMQFWRFWGTLLKDKNKERPRDAPIVQSHPAKLKHEQAHPKYCDNFKPCSKSQSCFEQPFSHKDLLCHPRSPLRNKSLSEKRAFCIPVKKVSQMSPVIQVQSHTGDGFPNRHKREQNSWLVTTPRLKARLRPDWQINVAEDQFVWKTLASRSLSSSVLLLRLLRLLRLKFQSNKGSIASFILYPFLSWLFCIVLLAKQWTQQQQRHPQRLYRVINQFLKKYLPVSVSFCLNHVLTAIGKTHISVLSLHNSHAAAASDILTVQTLVQIFQTLRIKKGPNLQS